MYFEREKIKVAKEHLAHDAALKAIQELAQLSIVDPALGECLVSVCIEAAEKLGVFIAHHPEALDAWAEVYDVFPTVAVREGKIIYNGLDYLAKKAEDHFVPIRRKRSLRSKGADPSLADGKCPLPHHKTLKQLVKISLLARDPDVLAATKIGVLVEEFLNDMHCQYPHALAEFGLPAPSCLPPTLSDSIESDLFLKLAQERNQKNPLTALKQVFRDTIKQVLKELKKEHLTNKNFKLKNS